MKLTKVDHRILNTYKENKIDAVIDEFIAMETPAAEIENHTYRTASSCAGTFSTALKRRRATHIKAMVRDNKVYLVDTLLVEKVSKEV